MSSLQMAKEEMEARSEQNTDGAVRGRPAPASNVFSSIPRRHKSYKSIRRGPYEQSRICKVQELNLKDCVIRNIPRGGVIFYTFINDKLYLCFGKDRRTNDLTDFGGGRHDRCGESPVHCAVREGNEESRYSFSSITVEQVQGFNCLFNSSMLIIFIPVMSPNELDIRNITCQNFSESKFLTVKQKKDRRYNEISEIIWLDEEQVSNIFSKQPRMQMFAKVRQFLYSCTQLSQDINQMKDILREVNISVPENLVHKDDISLEQYNYCLRQQIDNIHQKYPIKMVC